MTQNGFRVSLPQLVATLSDAVDLICTVLNNHHKQVAYISYMIGKELNFPNNRLSDLMTAALLHDVGALRLDDRLDLLDFEEKNPYRHTISGCLLLKDVDVFKRAGEIIRHHHLPWEWGAGIEFKGDPVHFESHILYVSDRTSVSINPQEEIINQVPTIIRRIRERSGARFHPQLVETLEALSDKEAFWLDLVSPDIDHRLKVIWGAFERKLDLCELLKVTRILARIIDFRSRFTSVHSSGVGAVAVAIARKMGWSDTECTKMAIAGNLHDLGKLAVPNSILEKPGKLTKEEYNIMKTHTYYSYYLTSKVEGLEDISEYGAFHHETLDGKGYPFRIKGEDLKEGSRIMAVADVFTAITEDRPYRKGMSDARAMEIIQGMAQNSKMDADIVALVEDYAGEINDVRRRAQEQAAREYIQFQKEIARSEQKV